MQGVKGPQGLEAVLCPAQGWGGELFPWSAPLQHPRLRRTQGKCSKVSSHFLPLGPLVFQPQRLTYAEDIPGPSSCCIAPGEETEGEPRPSLLSQLLTRLSSRLWFLTAVVSFCLLSPSWVFLKGSGRRGWSQAPQKRACDGPRCLPRLRGFRLLSVLPFGARGNCHSALDAPYTECTGVSAARRGKSKVWLSAQGAHNRAHVCCPSVTLSQVPHLTRQPPTRRTGALDACLFPHQAFSSQSLIALQDSAQTSSVKASSAPAPQHSVYTFHLCGRFWAGLKLLGLQAAALGPQRQEPRLPHSCSSSTT